MSRKAIQGFQALRHDTVTRGDEKAKPMMTNNNLPNYQVRTPTSRGTQTMHQMDSRTWSSSPSMKTNSGALQPLRTRSQSPQDMDVTPPVQGCICYREHTSVACCSCGLMLAGRVRIQCPCHPNTIHLMDVERCPECCSSTLTELRTT